MIWLLKIANLVPNMPRSWLNVSLRHINSLVIGRKGDTMPGSLVGNEALGRVVASMASIKYPASWKMNLMMSLTNSIKVYRVFFIEQNERGTISVINSAN